MAKAKKVTWGAVNGNLAQNKRSWPYGKTTSAQINPAFKLMTEQICKLVPALLALAASAEKDCDDFRACISAWDGITITPDGVISVVDPLDNVVTSWTYDNETGILTLIDNDPATPDVSVTINIPAIIDAELLNIINGDPTKLINFCWAVNECVDLGELRDNEDGTYTWVWPDGVDVFSFEMSQSTITETLASWNQIGIHDDGTGNQTILFESIVGLLENNDGTWTITNEAWDSMDVLTDLCQLPTITQAELEAATTATMTWCVDGENVNMPVQGWAVSEISPIVTSWHVIASHDDGNGNNQPIYETITPIVDNWDGTWTYTDEEWKETIVILDVCALDANTDDVTCDTEFVICNWWQVTDKLGNLMGKRIDVTYPWTLDGCDPDINDLIVLAEDVKWSALISNDIVVFWPYTYIFKCDPAELILINKEDCAPANISISLSNATLCTADVEAVVEPTCWVVEEVCVLFKESCDLKKGDMKTICQPITYVDGTTTYNAAGMEYLTDDEGFSSLPCLLSPTGTVYASLLVTVCWVEYESDCVSIETTNTLLPKLEDHDGIYDYKIDGVVDIHGSNEDWDVVWATPLPWWSNVIPYLPGDGYYTDGVDDYFSMPDTPAPWQVKDTISFGTWYSTDAPAGLSTMINLNLDGNTSTYEGLTFRLYWGWWWAFIYYGNGTPWFDINNEWYGAANFQDANGDNPPALNDGEPHFIQWSIPSTGLADAVVYVDGIEYTATVMLGDPNVVQNWSTPSPAIMWHEDTSVNSWWSLRTNANWYYSYIITDHIDLCEHRNLHNAGCGLSYDDCVSTGWADVDAASVQAAICDMTPSTNPVDCNTAIPTCSWTILVWDVTNNYLWLFATSADLPTSWVKPWDIANVCDMFNYIATSCNGDWEFLSTRRLTQDLGSFRWDVTVDIDNTTPDVSSPNNNSFQRWYQQPIVVDLPAPICDPTVAAPESWKKWVTHIEFQQYTLSLTNPNDEMWDWLSQLQFSNLVYHNGSFNTMTDYFLIERRWLHYFNDGNYNSPANTTDWNRMPVDNKYVSATYDNTNQSWVNPFLFQTEIQATVLHMTEFSDFRIQVWVGAKYVLVDI